MIKWINFIKAIALIAVVIDHNFHILYENYLFLKLTFFSVTTFVFLSGYTSTISFKKHKSINLINYLKKKFVTLIIPYLISVFLVLFIVNHNFSFQNYINSIIYFNADGIYYFVFFFLQLTIISPILYLLINNIELSKYKTSLNILLIVSIIVISICSLKYTNLLPLYGGGKYLFGGTYLIVYFMGMFISYYQIQKYSKSNLLVNTLVSFLFLCIWFYINYKGYFSFDIYLYLGEGINPPLIDLALYSILIIIFLKNFYYLFSSLNIRIINKILNLFDVLGRYTFIIFLFHKIVMNRISFLTWSENKLILLFVYFPLIFIIPIIGDKVINTLISGLRKLKLFKKVKNV